MKPLESLRGLPDYLSVFKVTLKKDFSRFWYFPVLRIASGFGWVFSSFLFSLIIFNHQMFLFFL